MAPNRPDIYSASGCTRIQSRILAHLVVSKCVLFLRLGIFKGQTRALGSVAKIRLYLVLRHRLARVAAAPRVTLGAFLGPVDHGAEIKCFLAVGNDNSGAHARVRGWRASLGEHTGKDAVIGSAHVVENGDVGSGEGAGLIA